MGHARLVVIVEPDTKADAIAQRVQEIMAPYDVDKEVEPYESFCDCTQDASLFWDPVQGRNIIAMVGRPGAEIGSPDPDCMECGGTGIAITTRNPRAEWDWYQPGGRFDGVIPDQLATNTFDNIALVQDIPADFDAWAVLTPDGEWHGSDVYGTRDDEAWAIEQAEIFRNYAGYLATTIDCHY